MKKLTPFQKKVARRWRMIIFCLALIFSLGCGSESLPPISSKQVPVLLEVEVIEYQSPEYHYPAKRLRRNHKCPRILIGCKSAILESDNRRIIVEGAERIAVINAPDLYPAFGWIADIKIEGAMLIFELYDNCSYAICINKDYRELPLLKNPN